MKKTNSQMLAFWALALLAALLSNGSVRAAAITWGPATTISADTDVSTVGTLVYAYNMSNTTQTVNTVAFTGSNSTTALGTNVTLTTWTTTNATVFTGGTTSPFAGLSTAYKAMLASGDYTANSATATIQLNALTVGKAYLVQIWVNDSRTTGGGRTDTITSTGGNTVVLSFNTAGAVLGGVGQYTIGSFVANAVTQSFTVAGASGAPAQFACIQVRDLGIPAAGTWSSTTTGALWSLATNWTTSVIANGPSVNATFASAIGADNTVNLDSKRFIGSLTFGATGTAFNWTLANNAVAANTLTLSNNGSPAVITVNSTVAAKTTTISAVLTGGGGLSVPGPGTLVLSGANTYTGVTAVGGGTLRLGNATALGLSAGNTIANGATLDLNGQTISNTFGTNVAGSVITNSSATAASITGTITAGAFTVNGTGNITLATVTTGAAITKSGTNTLTLSGTVDNVSAAITANGGIVVLGKTSTTAVHAYGGASSIGSGGTIQLGGTGDYQMYGGTNLTVSSGGVLDLNGKNQNWVGNGATGLLNLNGTGISNGGAVINNTVTTSTLTLGGTTSTIVLQSATSIGGTGNIIITGGGTNGAISGTGALTKIGTGTLTLSSANTYTGSTTISAGTLAIASTGSLANTAISATGPGTFLVTPGAGTVNLGNTGTVGAGASLNLGSGAVFSMTDGAIGTVSLLQGATFAGAALTLNTATLNFDMNGATPDVLTVTGSASVTGTNSINLTMLTAPTPGTYNLITAASGLSGTFVFGGTGMNTQTIVFGTNAYLVTLINSNTSLQVNVGAPTTTSSLTWSGQSNGSGAASPNWDSGVSNNWAAGATPVAFGNGTAVAFGDTNAVNGGAAITTNTLTVASLGVSPLSTSFNNSAVNYTVGGGVIGGTGTLMKSGSGSLTLTGANTYSGDTTVSGGTLQLGDGTVNGTFSPGLYQLSAGTTLYLNYATAVSAPTGGYLSRVRGSGTLRLNSAQAVTGLANWGPNLATAIPFDPGFTGTLQMDKGRMDSSPAGLGGIPTIVINSGAQFLAWTGTYTQNFTIAGAGWGETNQPGALRTAGSSNNAVFNGTITLSADAGINSQDTSSVMTISGTITGGFGISKENAGPLTLTGINTYTGATSINSGTLIIKNSASLPAASAINLGLGTLQYLDDGAGSNGTISRTGNNITLSVSGTAATIINVGNNGSANTGNTVAFGALNNGTTLNALSGTINFTASNGYLQSYSSLGLTGLTGGNTTLNPTTTSVIIAGNVTNQESGSVTGHFDTLTLSGTSSGNAINGVISDNANFASVGNGDTRVTKSGTSTWILNGGNIYSGPTVISAGSLRITNGFALGSTTSGTTQSGSSALEIDGTGGAVVVGAEALSISGGGIINFGALRNIAGDNTYGGTITLAAQSRINSDSGTLTLNNPTAITGAAQNLVIGGTGNITISGAIATTTGFVARDGTGTLTLSGANTYTGTTSASAGTISLTGSIASSNISTSGAAVLSESATGLIAGTGTFIQGSSGTSTLAGTNTFSGATTVNAGTLVLDYSTQNNSKLSDTAALVLGGGILDLKGGSHTEIVASTTLTANTASRVTSSTPGSVLQMNTITPGAGASIDFGAPNIATTDNLNNSNGILGAWATINGGTDFAVNSTNAADGPITAPTYTDVPRLNGGTQVIGNGATNVRIVEGIGTAADITLSAAITTIGSLTQSTFGGTSAATIDSGNQTLQANAILVSTGAGALTIGNGILTSATSGGDLGLTNSTANGFTINSVIANNTTASTLSKLGVGTLNLTAANTYTGATTIGAGTLTLSGAGQLGGGAYAGTISIAAGSTFQYSSIFDQTLSGAISGAGVLIKDTNGSNLSLTAANTYSGNTTVNAGTLTLAGATGVGTAGGYLYNGLANTATVTVASGAQIVISSNNSTVHNALGFGASATWNVSGTINSTGGDVHSLAGNVMLNNGTLTGVSNATFGTFLANSGASAPTITANGNSNTISAVNVGMNTTLTLATPLVTDALSISSALGVTPTYNTGALIKTGLGSVTLSGASIYVGTTTVTAGKLIVTGSTNQGTAASDVLIANTATGNAVLNLQGSMTARYLSVGGVTGASGAVYMSSGTYTGGADTELGFTFGAGATTGGYGYLGMSGGTVNINRFQFGGQNVAAQNGVGVGLITGGTVNAGSYVILARYGTTVGTIGTLTVATGGTLNHTSATNGQNFGLGWQGAGRAELNLTGGTITSATGRILGYGAGGTAWTGTGIVNLDAGTLTTTAITTQGTGASSYLNFCGGTLKAVSAQAAFLPALTGVYLNGAFGTFSGGGVIDTNSVNVTISAALLAPTGNGVSSVPVTNGGSGYIGAPAVSITDGGPGFGATAIANMVDDGTGNGTFKISSITVTNPGNNYSAPVAALVGGGNGATAATLGTLTISANISGGLTKNNAGTLTLTGTNTYSGATIVSGGTLQLEGSAVVAPSTSNITVNTGATLGFTAGTVSTLNLTGKSMTLSGGTVAFDIGTGVNDAITVNDLALTANSVFTFNILGAVSGTYTLVTSTNPIVTNGFTLTPQTIGNLILAPAIIGNTITLSVTFNEGVWNQDSDGLWNTFSGTGNPNWDNYKPSVAGDVALFGSVITAPRLVTVDAAQVVGYIRFDNANAYTIGSGASSNLTLSNGATTAQLTVTSGSHTIAENVALLSNVFVSPATGTTLTLSGILSGTTTVTHTGKGSSVLSGVNTNTGVLNVSSGTVTLSGARTAAATGGVTVGNLPGNTGTLNISNGTFTVGTTGSNFLVGNGDNTVAGILNQTGGTLTTIGNQLLIGNGGTGTTAGSNSFGTYNLSNGTLTTIAGTLGVVLGVNTGTTGTFNLSGTGILNMPATSTLQITRSDNSAANTVTGTFNQTGGTATVGILQMGGSNTTPANNANNNATLNLSGGTFAATTFNQLSGANTSTSVINISGTADVTLPAFPTARGTGATATITFDGGKLRPAATSAAYMGSLTNAFIKAGGLNIEIASGRDITISQNLLTDLVSTGGGLTKSGDPAIATSLTLSGTNTYTGGTTINAGRISVSTAPSLSTGTITITGDSTVGGQLFVGGIPTITNNFVMSGVGYPDAVTTANTGRAGAIRAGTGQTYSGKFTLAGDARFGVISGACSNTISGQITGPFGMDFYGGLSTNTAAQIFILANIGTANDFTGNTSITSIDFNGARTGGSAILQLGASEQIPSGVGKGNLVFNGADANHIAIFELNGFNETINGVANAVAAGAIIRNTAAGASVLSIGDADTTSTYPGVIADGGVGRTLAIAKIGTGTLALSGASTFTGNVTVNNGTLAAQINASGSNTALGSATNTRTITINANGILRFDAPNVFSGTWSQSNVPTLAIIGGTVTNADPAVTNGNNNALGNLTLTNGTLNATVGSHSGYGAWDINGTVTSSGNSFVTSSDAVFGTVVLNSAGPGSTPAFTTFNVTDGTLQISAPLAQNAGTGDERVSGLIKTGTGRLILNSNNTYSGLTTVNAGTLVVNANTSTSSGVSIAAGATLRGTGTVSAITNLAGAGNPVLWPGAATGAFSLTTNETLTATSADLTVNAGKLNVVINNSVPATQKLVLTGAAGNTLNVDNSSVLSLAFDTTVNSGVVIVDLTGGGAISQPFLNTNVLAGTNTYGTHYHVTYKSVNGASFDSVDPIGGDFKQPASNVGSAGPYNKIVIQLVSGVTPVKIADFAAASTGAGVNISWTAVSEYQNAGFNIYRRNSQGGEWTLVNPALISGRITNPDEKIYSFFDWASAGEWQYKLESVDLSGSKETYEQFAGPVFVDWNSDLSAVTEVDGGSVSVVNDGLAVVAGVRNAQAVSAAIATMKQDAVAMNKVTVRDLTDVATASHIAVRNVASAAITSKTSSLTSSHVGVRWFSSAKTGGASFAAAKLLYSKPGVMIIPQSSMPSGFDLNKVMIQREGRNFNALAKVPAGLLVFATGYADDYTDKDALFIRKSTAATNVVSTPTSTGLFNSSAPVNVTSPATATAEFHDTYFEYDAIYRPLTFAPWFSSKYLTSGTTQDFVINLAQPSSGPTKLTLNLWSLTSDAGANPDHALQLVVNGQIVGETSWDGGNKMMQLSFDLPAGVLNAGDNTVSVVTPTLSNVSNQICFMHSITANYTRSLDGSKSFEIVNNSSSSQLYELNNVPSTGAWIVDTRFSDRASLVATESQVQADGTLRVRFMASAGGSGKFVVTPVGQENQPISITARQVKAAKLNGSYLAAGPLQFSSGVQPLLMKRSKEGIRGAYFDQEQLFDYYNFGRYGPDGIRNAVRSLKPTYLLLVGRTTYDYRNYEGQNIDPLCPTYLVSTSFWAQSTSDSAFGDLGRGYPEVAVGRLPVNDTTELAGAVSHILGYKGIPQSGLRLHAVADKPDATVADFGSELDTMLKANQPDVSWQENYLGRTFATVAEVTHAMKAAANGGADLIVYSGHGSAAHLGRDDPRILNAGTVQEWNGNVVFLQSTCTANWMAKNVSGYRSVAIQALTQPQGGISASIGTSTYMNSDVAVSFTNQLLKSVNKNARWGTALMSAQQWAGKQTKSGFFTDMMNTEQLFGDPAMPIYAPKSINTAPANSNSGAGTPVGTF